MTKMVFCSYADYTHNRRMKNNKQNTKQILSVFVELSKHIPPYLTSKVATELRRSEPDIKLNARTFSLWSQTASMLYCQLAHCLSLNDVCDSLNFHRAELNSLRNATAPCRNTLSHANRTRDSRFIQKVFWAQLEHLQQAQPEFLQDGARRYFRLPRHIKRAVRAIDSTTIELIAKCMEWAKHRKRKAAAKLHMVLDIATFLPIRIVADAAKPHDSTRMVELCAGMKEGEIAVFDKAYVAFSHLYTLHQRGIFWVTRAKDNMCYETVKPLNIGRMQRIPKTVKISEGSEKQTQKAKRLQNQYLVVLKDEQIRLISPISQKQYSEPLRLIEAQVKADNGEIKTMRFISNNMTWAASSICDLYRCRWAIEIFFKEIKQTLQIKTFLGFNQNAIEWQIWTAMLTYLILRYVAFMSKWKGSFKHLFTLVKGTLWLKRTVKSVVEFYGTASSKIPIVRINETPYLLGLNWDAVE